MQARRVVITGIGIVSALGANKDVFWKRLTSGHSGIRRITKFDATDYASKIAAEVVEYDLDAFVPKKEQRRMDQFCHYAMGAARLAMQDSGLDMARENPERVGVLVTSGVGGLQTLEEQHTVLVNKGPGRCSPFMIPQMIVNIPAGLIAIEYNMQGPNFAVVSACASSAHAVGDALRLIQRGDADVIVTGGAEAAVCSLGIAGFCAMRALSTRNDDPQKASRPFDRDRDGFVMGEGAAVVMIEEYEHARQRGATIYCEVGGFGMSCDAFHMTAPADDGSGAARAMQMAMKDAGVTADAITYINAHGTSTPLNDKIETRAIKRALGETAARKVMISSSKSMTGHLLGAAGALETAVCAMAIQTGVVPPTINQENPDPDCDLDYVPNTARSHDVRVCLNNSLGFGGHNACVLLRKL
ncbi:MAG: beta-ketoacyl-[acyl-carrier-protein] synthase II [Lentisphaerae bacterium RIFOXYC12_FULL_60_16]|nr:MAG: beta-ketoacyl-[acyl-carrier-protein] synthase II [Lentisphaerae bacterium RIFOXYC12_FULL_60_16]OGV73367.1 MAG: beta-ketoacyl-[acyl-carrier-protein] synthase II [Lentisphaerae bacterium RIFOXYA12_FULL_60_10]OGV83479.1 MAG: beta-ketoacyl-[acyl-carrier-protein] synthase II [Lentisphaerae bacterium RIFOXYB12_FULL_60_10]